MGLTAIAWIARRAIIAPREPPSRSSALQATSAAREPQVLRQTSAPLAPTAVVSQSQIRMIVKRVRLAITALWTMPILQAFQSSPYRARKANGPIKLATPMKGSARIAQQVESARTSETRKEIQCHCHVCQGTHVPLERPLSTNTSALQAPTPICRSTLLIPPTPRTVSSALKASPVPLEPTP